MGGNPSNKLEKQIQLLNSPSGSAHSTSGTKKKNPTKLNSTNQLFIVNYSLASIPNTAKICLFIFIWSLKKSIATLLFVCVQAQRADLHFCSGCFYLIKEKQQNKK